METVGPIESMLKATGILATATLIFSIIYDWGFFFALDMGFLDIPSSIGDHVRSALVWLPNTLLVFFLIIAFEFVSQRIERGLTEEEIIQSSKNPEKMRKFRRGPLVLFRIFAPVTVAAFLLIGDSYRALLPISLIIVWSMISEWIVSAPLIKERRNKTVIELFHTLPMVFFFLFFMGYNQASDLASKKNSSIKLFYETSGTSTETRVLRLFDKGMLTIDPKTKAISFYSWTKIEGYRKIEVYTPYSGILGKMLSNKAENVSDQIE